MTVNRRGGRLRISTVVAIVAMAICAGAADTNPAAADGEKTGELNGPARATHVIGEDAIQARIDRQSSQIDRDRETIQILLRRPEIRAVAGAAGVDLERASMAAATLTGRDLADLAAKAREINASLAAGHAGGDDTIVISATTLIIILLLLILLLR